MCLRCGRLWTALQVLWSTMYIICGAAQLMAAIFFTISIPQLQPFCNLLTGSWNIIIGIGGGMVACIGLLSPRRQEILLYMSISVLIVNCINVILTELKFHYEMPKLINNYPNHMLIEYACFATRVAAALVLVVSFLDSQLSFCSMQVASTPTTEKNKLKGSHEQVSDIEYIIPRAKSSKPQSNSAYSQSWVFDTENASCSTNNLKVVQNGTPKKIQNGIVSDTTSHLIDNPVVHIEEASDDSTSNSDRKLYHMKSFSRSASPVVLSASSSQISLNLTNPPIYECLEKLTSPTIYRSRLNTALSNKEEDEEEPHYQAPQAVMMRRVEATSPLVEKVQYASLMKELQRAIVSKKEPSASNVASPISSNTTTSDGEFSKELEAALQLIQDLESPNTIETPSKSETKPLAVWRNSYASESEKTLSAVGSLGEITSPIADQPSELYTTFKPSANGKSASVVVHYPDSQSTSGYSSPTQHSNVPTPNWSTTSSINGSNTEIVKPISYSIHNAKSTTVISLYTQPNPQSKGKSVTLVTISGDNDPVKAIHNSTQISDFKPNDSISKDISPIRTLPTAPLTVWSLLRKKKQSTLPKLCPELEGAIIKSESLAYLSELELLARHQRNKEIHREIEERVIQQLGTPRTESNC